MRIETSLLVDLEDRLNKKIDRLKNELFDKFELQDY